MLRTGYHWFCVLLLAVLVTGCSPIVDDLPAPVARTASADFSYGFYSTPEAVVYAAVTSYQNYRIPFVLGRSLLAGGHPIYAFRPTMGTANNPKGLPGSWQPVAGPKGGGVVKLVLAKYADAGLGQEFYVTYAIDDRQKLWYHEETTAAAPGTGTTSSTWVDTGVRATDVALQVIADSAGRRLAALYLGTDSLAGGHSIHTIQVALGKGASASPADFRTAEPAPGAAGVGIALDPRARAWVVTRNQQIWVSGAGYQGYQQIGGGGVGLTTAGFTVVLLGTAYHTTGYEVYKRSAQTSLSTYSWSYEGGELVQVRGLVEAPYADYFVGVSSNGELYSNE